MQPWRVNPACQMPPQGSLDYFGHLFFVLKGSADPQGRTVGHRKGNNYSCQKIAQIMQGNPLITTYIFSWELLPETRAEINVTRLFVRLSVRLFALPIWKLEFHKIFFNNIVLYTPWEKQKYNVWSGHQWQLQCHYWCCTPTKELLLYICGVHQVDWKVTDDKLSQPKKVKASSV